MEDATPVVKEMLDDAWESVLKKAAMKEALRKAPPVAGFTDGFEAGWKAGIWHTVCRAIEVGRRRSHVDQEKEENELLD